MQNKSSMLTKEMETFFENPESQHLAETATKLDFCMEHYRPYIRHDFNMHQLSVIANIPVSDIEFYFSRSHRSFIQYIDEWRIKHAKNLMNKGNTLNLELKSIGSLSGFSSCRKFTEAFTTIEGISPEIYQSQINKSIS
jgi:transcriptional regulator GlxA family with amidase domain